MKEWIEKSHNEGGGIRVSKEMFRLLGSECLFLRNSLSLKIIKKSFFKQKF